MKMTALPVFFLALLCTATQAAPAQTQKAPPARNAAAPGAGTAATPAEGTPAAADTQVDGEALPPPSSAAQKVYSAAKADLLQLRILLRNGRSQSSVGSGFLIGTSNLVVTNYHVVSQMALDPDVYTGEWLDTNGNSGPLELLAVDVLHDLAVVRINRNGTGVFNLPDQPARLTQGQYLYSLGNPLDLGFAISEGAYNGVIMRSFYQQLLFTGPINSGMSGGPSVTGGGAVAGVNVSKRLDGELVSFLVPVKYAKELLEQARTQKAPPADFTQVIGQQLLAHQRSMVDTLLEKPLAIKTMGPYRVPVRESEQMRCWGHSNVKAEASFTVDTIRCTMEASIYVSDSQQTGRMSMTHQYIRSDSLDTLRFSSLASSMFTVTRLGTARDRRLTAPSCTEKFVRSGSLPLRAVACVRAYRKFEGLYDFTLLTASTDDGLASLQSRLDLDGVSYEYGMRTTRAFLQALGRGSKQ